MPVVTVPFGLFFDVDVDLSVGSLQGSPPLRLDNLVDVLVTDFELTAMASAAMELTPPAPLSEELEAVRLNAERSGFVVSWVSTWNRYATMHPRTGTIYYLSFTHKQFIAFKLNSRNQVVVMSESGTEPWEAELDDELPKLSAELRELPDDAQYFPRNTATGDLPENPLYGQSEVWRNHAMARHLDAETARLRRFERAGQPTTMRTGGAAPSIVFHTNPHGLQSVAGASPPPPRSTSPVDQIELQQCVAQAPPAAAANELTDVGARGRRSHTSARLNFERPHRCFAFRWLQPRRTIMHFKRRPHHRTHEARRPLKQHLWRHHSRRHLKRQPRHSHSRQRRDRNSQATTSRSPTATTWVAGILEELQRNMPPAVALDFCSDRQWLSPPHSRQHRSQHQTTSTFVTPTSSMLVPPSIPFGSPTASMFGTPSAPMFGAPMAAMFPPQPQLLPSMGYDPMAYAAAYNHQLMAAAHSMLARGSMPVNPVLQPAPLSVVHIALEPVHTTVACIDARRTWFDQRIYEPGDSPR